MKYRVPHLIPLVGLLMFTAAGALLLWFFVFQEDAAGYKKLAERAGGACLGPSKGCEGSQMRYAIDREIWYVKDGQRYHVILTSRDSELFFVRQDLENALRETMQDVRCVLQEKFTEEMQQVKIIYAEKAVYDYVKEELIAENVHMEEYELPGRTISSAPPSTAPLSRTCSPQVRVSFKPTGIQIQTDKLHLERP